MPVVHQRKIAFVIGGAWCVWKDLEAARALCAPDIICVVNDTGLMFQEHIDIWCSYHADQLAAWVLKREKAGLPPASVLYTGTARSRRAPDNAKRLNTRGGSSGMLATYAALKEGATHVILAGVPLNPEMRHITNKAQGRPWSDGRHYQVHWRRDYGKLRHKVRSVSGFTMHLLGAPTTEWLDNPTK